MPIIRKLSPDEVRTTIKTGESQRAQTAREYDSYLAEFTPNEYGAVDIDEATEAKLTVKNRLKAAAARRGWELHFLRTAGPQLRFEVRDQREPVANDGTDTIEDPEERAEGTLADEPAQELVRRRRKKGGAADA